MSEMSPLQQRGIDAFKSGARLFKADLSVERQLHHTKWFDYRFISSADATEHFAQIYERTKKQKLEAPTSDCGSAVKARYAPDQYKCFWRARQFADSLGLPYDAFLSCALKFLLETGNKRVPYVNQLYGKTTRNGVEKAVSEHWSACREAEFQFSTLPQYKVEHFRKLPAQIAHREWVINEIRGPFQLERLVQACFVHRILHIDDAISEFGDEFIDRAAEYDITNAAPMVPPFPLLPSCFGLPHAVDSTSKECLACPSNSICYLSHSLCLNRLREVYKSDCPADNRRRALQRRRTRKHRARCR